MSKSKLIALAITAALAAPNAYAISINDGGGVAGSAIKPTKVATVDIKDATTAVGLNGVDIYVSGSDLIIGRTTGFSVRLDLQDGAKFDVAPAALPTIGAALPMTAGGVAGWTVSLAAGGQAGDTFAVYSVQPGADSAGVINGQALTFGAGAIVIDNAAGLATAGSTVSLKVTFADPGTAQPILDPKTVVVATSGSVLDVDMATNAVANPNAKIDVGTTANTASKTRFANDGVVSSQNQSTTFESGTLTIGVNTGISAAAGGAFAWDPADTFDLTLNGSFAAFTTAAGGSVRLAQAGCAAGGANDIAGTVTATKVTFADVTKANFDLSGATVCFDAKAGNTAVIEESAVAVDVVATRTATAKTENDLGNAGLPLDYNGSQAKVWNFNPGGNIGQQSYLRITNPSALAGKVTVTGVCDNGTASTGAAVFDLGAGETKTITAQDIENGSTADGVVSTLGSCTAGKWRLDVTGEFGGMRVQNFLRNNMSSGIINTSVNNTEY